MHGLRGVKLFHALVAVAVGVLGHQAHQRLVEETVLVGRAVGGHETVGARVAVDAHLHHDVVERRGGDGQRGGRLAGL
jgi:hypothetical protein